MNRWLRWLLLAVLVLGALFAAWRVLWVTRADGLAKADPERTLGMAPRQPEALLALAERQLSAGQRQQAVATARRLLSVEPLQGRGFRVLAQAAEQEGDAASALALYEIAVRRSPRDVTSRAWLAQHYLEARDFRAALEQIDMILRVSPRQQAGLLPILVQLANDPDFAAELGRTLQSRPEWRGNLLSLLQRSGEAAASDAVLSALQREGGLSSQEFDSWIDDLMGAGRWGTAYSYWASLPATGKLRLTPVYNGGFESEPGSRGFDWRVTRIPGVVLEFAATPGSNGLAAHVLFRDRRVSGVNLEQPLLLAPGQYRLSARMRADRLQSASGLEWAVFCREVGMPVATSERVTGSFDWREVGMDFIVPDSACDGQWLRLRNPVPAGSGQRVSGELWFDDVRIVPIAPHQPVAGL